jgi:hypothetical protein
MAAAAAAAQHRISKKYTTGRGLLAHAAFHNRPLNASKKGHAPCAGCHCTTLSDAQLLDAQALHVMLLLFCVPMMWVSRPCISYN